MTVVHLTNNGPKDCAIISFQPHNVCNYTCDYCHSSSNGGDQRWNDDYKAVVKFVNTIRERNKFLYLEILGGEPTLWPSLTDFIAEVAHDNLIIELNSNGSRTLRYWNEFPAGNLIINFSWHSKEVDTDHLFRVVEIMKDKIYVIVTVLMTPDSFNNGILAVQKFKSLNVEVDVKPARKSIIEAELYDFTKEQLQHIGQYVQDRTSIYTPKWHTDLYPTNIIINNKQLRWRNIVINNEHTYTGWRCTAGINRFIINPAGNITRCYPGVGGIIGNVFTGYELPVQPITCSYNRPCHCKLDAMVEKWSPDE